jgi:hypothetical protein
MPTRRIRSDFPDAHIIILTQYDGHLAQGGNARGNLPATASKRTCLNCDKC